MVPLWWDLEFVWVEGSEGQLLVWAAVRECSQEGRRWWLEPATRSSEQNTQSFCEGMQPVIVVRWCVEGRRYFHRCKLCPLV